MYSIRLIHPVHAEADAIPEAPEKLDTFLEASEETKEGPEVDEEPQEKRKRPIEANKEPTNREPSEIQDHEKPISEAIDHVDEPQLEQDGSETPSEHEKTYPNLSEELETSPEHDASLQELQEPIEIPKPKEGQAASMHESMESKKASEAAKAPEERRKRFVDVQEASMVTSEAQETAQKDHEGNEAPKDASEFPLSHAEMSSKALETAMEPEKPVETTSEVSKTILEPAEETSEALEVVPGHVQELFETTETVPVPVEEMETLQEAPKTVTDHVETLSEDAGTVQKSAERSETHPETAEAVHNHVEPTSEALEAAPSMETSQNIIESFQEPSGEPSEAQEPLADAKLEPETTQKPPQPQDDLISPLDESPRGSKTDLDEGQVTAASDKSPSPVETSRVDELEEQLASKVSQASQTSQASQASVHAPAHSDEVPMDHTDDESMPTGFEDADRYATLSEIEGGHHHRTSRQATEDLGVEDGQILGSTSQKMVQNEAKTEEKHGKDVSEAEKSTSSRKSSRKQSKKSISEAHNHERSLENPRSDSNQDLLVNGVHMNILPRRQSMERPPLPRRDSKKSFSREASLAMDVKSEPIKLPKLDLKQEKASRIPKRRAKSVHRSKERSTIPIRKASSPVDVVRGHHIEVTRVQKLESIEKTTIRKERITSAKPRARDAPLPKPVARRTSSDIRILPLKTGEEKDHTHSMDVKETKSEKLEIVANQNWLKKSHLEVDDEDSQATDNQVSEVQDHMVSIKHEPPSESHATLKSSSANPPLDTVFKSTSDYEISEHEASMPGSPRPSEEGSIHPVETDDETLISTGRGEGNLNAVNSLELPAMRAKSRLETREEDEGRPESDDEKVEKPKDELKKEEVDLSKFEPEKKSKESEDVAKEFWHLVYTLSKMLSLNLPEKLNEKTDADESQKRRNAIDLLLLELEKRLVDKRKELSSKESSKKSSTSSHGSKKSKKVKLPSNQVEQDQDIPGATQLSEGDSDVFFDENDPEVHRAAETIQKQWRKSRLIKTGN